MLGGVGPGRIAVEMWLVQLAAEDSNADKFCCINLHLNVICSMDSTPGQILHPASSHQPFPHHIMGCQVKVAASVYTLLKVSI